MDLGERDALDRDRDLDEVAAVALEVREPIEATDFPGRTRVGEPKLRDCERPGKVGERTLAFEMSRDVDLVEVREVVLHGMTPFREKRKATVGTVASLEGSAAFSVSRPHNPAKETCCNDKNRINRSASECSGHSPQPLAPWQRR